MKNLKDDRLKKSYDDIIKKQLDEGIIEKADCSREYLENENAVTHYLPHHGVSNGKKTYI